MRLIWFDMFMVRGSSCPGPSLQCWAWIAGSIRHNGHIDHGSTAFYDPYWWFDLRILSFYCCGGDDGYFWRAAGAECDARLVLRFWGLSCGLPRRHLVREWVTGFWWIRHHFFGCHCGGCLFWHFDRARIAQASLRKRRAYCCFSHVCGVSSARRRRLVYLGHCRVMLQTRPFLLNQTMLV